MDKTARNFDSFVDWLIHARDTLHLSPQQALASWVDAKIPAPVNEQIINKVAFFRRGCALMPGDKLEISPEKRARLFARNTALNIIHRALQGENILALELRNAPVVILAHDIESENEGGCKMFCVAPPRYVVERAFASIEERFERARTVFDKHTIVPADHLRKNFKAEWAVSGQNILNPPATSLYNERMGGYEDSWEKDGEYAKPYTLVLDLDAQSVVDNDASRFTEAREMMERGRAGEKPFVRQICDIVGDAIMKATGEHAQFLTFTSEGAKPSYRIYVRVTAPEQWTHTKTVALVFADLNDVSVFVQKEIISQVSARPWFRKGMLDTKTFSKGWDRIPGMSKWNKKKEKMRFCQQAPMSALSDLGALEDWNNSRERCLLTSLGIVYDTPRAPIKLGYRVSALKRTHSSLLDGEKSADGEGTTTIEAIINEILARYPRACRSDFTPGKCFIDYKDGAPYQAKLSCGKGNVWCPYRCLEVDPYDGTLVASERADKQHAPMNEGKLACFIKLQEPFPCLEVNCFSDKCRKEGERYFNIGRLMPEQRTRLLRALYHSADGNIIEHLQPTV